MGKKDLMLYKLQNTSSVCALEYSVIVAATASDPAHYNF